MQSHMGWRCRLTEGSWPDDRARAGSRSTAGTFYLRRLQRVQRRRLRGRSWSGTSCAQRGQRWPGILHELSGITDPMFFHGLPYPDSPHFTRSTTTPARPPPTATRACSPRPRSPSTLYTCPTGPDQQHALDGAAISTKAIARLSSPRPAGELQMVDQQLDLRDRGPAHRGTLLRMMGTPNSTSTSARLSPCSPLPAASVYPSIRPSTSGNTAEGGRNPQAGRRGSPRGATRRPDQHPGPSGATDEDGIRDRLTDREIDSFVPPLLGAASGHLESRWAPR